MRENLEHPTDRFLHLFFSEQVESVVPLVPNIRQMILEQETDMLVSLKLKDRAEFILHLEFQTRNDPGMAMRMASYDFMVHLKHRQEVVSIVIYIGNEQMTMSNTVSFNGNYYQCQLIDIRDIDPELFLQSESSKEIILAVLAGKSDHDRGLIVQRILSKLQELLQTSVSELRERMKGLEILASLRSSELQKLIIKEEQKMPIIYDIRKDLRYQQGISDGKMQGKLEGRNEGVAKTLTATAINMLKEGFDINQIHKVTLLSVATIKELKEKLQLKD